MSKYLKIFILIELLVKSDVNFARNLFSIEQQFHYEDINLSNILI
jgi:hypothetical protein